MIVIITGATGFIGRALCRELVETGHEVIALSRNANKARELLGDKVTNVQWDGKSSLGWASYTEGAGAIVNLAGESISSGRWTQAKKNGILQSRLDAGKAVVETVSQAKAKPKVVIQASGIGYYGSRSDELVDESSSPGKGFLAHVAQKWEASTEMVESMGVRQVVIRTGVVLGKDGGALPRLLTPFRLFLGGPLGSGRQYFPWIHLQDEVKAIRFLIGQENLRGAFNLAAPESLTQKEFCRILGQVLKRPSWFPVPGFALRMIFGEMAGEVLLAGQRAVPKKLLDAGFEFSCPAAESALKDILSSSEIKS
jgi:uncharacterized protein (TIGR01777 family)